MCMRLCVACNITEGSNHVILHCQISVVVLISCDIIEVLAETGCSVRFWGRIAAKIMVTLLNLYTMYFGTAPTQNATDHWDPTSSSRRLRPQVAWRAAPRWIYPKRYTFRLDSETVVSLRQSEHDAAWQELRNESKSCQLRKTLKIWKKH